MDPEKKIKIGILTFHCAHNYGAVLQCYATQEILINLGYDVEIINYRPRYLLQPYKIFNIRRFLSKNPISIIKKSFLELLLLKLRYKRSKGFDEFINNRLKIGDKVTYNTISSDYDFYIVGSDQIWNPKITQGFDGVYFCNFPFPKQSKKYISYAASMEAKSLSEKDIYYYKNALRNFDYISVREAYLLDMLQPLVDKPIKHVLDPTLIASLSVWEKLCSNKYENSGYVVVYQVRVDENTIRIAQHVAQQIGAKVKILVAWPQRNSQELFQDATPEEFVETIRNAACVVTTSFHGTAFSVIFNRPFYTIALNDGADSRSSSLLCSLGLEDRLISANDLPKFSPINYSNSNKKLEILRRESFNFIYNSINNAQS